MKKTEIVFRELIESWSTRLSQLELSKRLGISLSTVNNAVKPLAAMGAVVILPKGIKCVDKEKLLLYWASTRNLGKEIIYSTRVDALPSAIEKSMPSGVVYTAYSGYKFAFDDVPADYSEVYVYGTAAEIEKRFPVKSGPPNLFVLAADKRLPELAKNNIAPLSQIFVDLWNIKEWYANEFMQALKQKVIK